MTTVTLNAPVSMDRIADKMFITILPEEVNQILQKKDSNSIIFDVRETKDFNKGHVPGAINLPKGNWGKISGLKYEMKTIIYSYSRMGSMAAKAIQEFVKSGFPAMEMQGGFEAWKENRLPVEI